jgi:hypothetical protein
MGRASDLYVSAQIKSGFSDIENGRAPLPSPRVTDVRVGGSTVLVAKGRLFLP